MEGIHLGREEQGGGLSGELRLKRRVVGGVIQGGRDLRKAENRGWGLLGIRHAKGPVFCALLCPRGALMFWLTVSLP